MESSRRFFHILALLACFVIVHGAAATPYEIRFQSGSFLPESGSLRIPESQAERVHALMQLEDYLAAGQQEALGAAGVELLQYLPDRAYVVSVRKDADAIGLKALGVRYLGDLRAEHKIHPRITLRQFGKWSEYSQGRRILSVDIMPDVLLDDAAVQLVQIGCEVGHRFEAAHTVLVAVEAEKALEIAGLDAVLFVNESSPPLDELNNSVRQRLHVDELRLAPYNLTGNGVIALVFDGDLADSTHPDFGGRLRWMEAGADSDHATHVSGTLGGNGQVSGGTYAGMAPQARIISGAYDLCNPYCFYESANDVEPDYTIARTVHHVEVTSNSIGANIDPNSWPIAWFGDYETTSRLLDRLVRNTAGTPLMQFWAAGNEMRGEHYYWTTYGCMSIPAGAKNIITCGSTDNADAISDFSSWGPTDDGRVKPELCATGEDVISCVIGGGYAIMYGTSMSTPASAGVACLILQEWHQLFPESPDPLPETMKAILINSATDIGPVGPDFQSGYGVVNALKAVQNLIAGGVLEGALEVGETFTHNFTVPAGLSVLDVSLAWSDMPGAAMVIPTLVNDLDLELQAPNATIYYPWKLRPSQPNSAAITGVDSVNVCERVHVVSPAAGTWTLRVRGRLNGSASQSFGLSANAALVSSWAGITGQIRNAANGQGIPGRISMVGGSLSVITDTSGSFMFSVPANVQYTFRAESYGFAPHDTTFTITTGPVIVNLSLTSAQNGTISGTVVNQFGFFLTGAVVQISFPGATIPPVTTGAGGTFSVNVPGGIIYDVLANYGGMSDLVSVLVPAGGTANVALSINHPRFRPAGPDAYGYYAYEIGDSASTAAYDWLEISPNAGGSGTLIPSGGGNDWVATVNTPFQIRFYGQTTNQIQVGADGWIRVGATETADSVYMNLNLPNVRVPNGLICLFWDDLFPYDPTAGGDISYYHDQAQGRFIIEYHLVPHYAPRTNLTTAQLVFFNTSMHPTASGDNEFLLQYQRLDREDNTEDADATIGIEDFEGDDGIEIVFDIRRHKDCFEPAPQTAILFSPGGIQGLGAVHGEIAMIPPPPDWSAVNVTVGVYVSHPDPNGAFLIDSIPPGSYLLAVSLQGYETGRVETLVVAVDDTAQTAFTLYRLDPATNLTGEYNPETQQIYLHWNWPLWHSAQLATNPRMGEHLDIFRNFRVWIAGLGLQGSPSDTFFTYTVHQSRSFRIWIETVYDGGTADTSNNFRITIDLSAEQISGVIPMEFYLKQNYPNPFNPLTMIEYGLPKTARVTLDVYDVLGRKVAVLQDGVQEPGAYRVRFDGAGLGSGVYYCRLKTAEFERVQKMLLMR